MKISYFITSNPRVDFWITGCVEVS